MNRLVTFVLLVLFTGCNTTEKAFPECPTTESILAFPWVTERIQGPCDVCYHIVYQAAYHGQNVIYFYCGGTVCDCSPDVVLYDCRGKQIKAFSGSAADLLDEKENLVNVTLLYSCTE